MTPCTPTLPCAFRRLTTLAVLALLALMAACSDAQPDGGKEPTADAAGQDVLACDAPPCTALPADASATSAGRLPPCTDDEDCIDQQGPCRRGACLATLGCIAVIKADGTPCDDGDICTSPGACTLGGCAPGAGDACDDDNPCTSDDCSAAAGCSHLPMPATPCEDGDPCTRSDSCKEGVCEPGPGVCACTSDADCAGDGDLCKGIFYCNKNDGPWHCTKVPLSAVNCSQEFNAPCKVNTCQPDSGGCKLKPVAPGAACDDGQPCTQNFCDAAGTCKVAIKNVCQCLDDGDCAKFDDNNLCNGKLYCDTKAANWACVINPATVVACDAQNDADCIKNSCVPATGKCQATAVQDLAPCSDGNTCTQGDVCKQGVCTGGQPTCQCQKDADCAGQEDGDFCNGTLYCDTPTQSCLVNPASVVSCPSVADSTCQANLCQPKTGVCKTTAVANGQACDDHNACTPDETCSQGQCTTKNNTCACSKDADCVAKDDGDLCNGTMYCLQSSGKCLVNPAPVVSCPTVDDTACTRRRCQAKTGDCALTAMPTLSSCDDGNPCTPFDLCKQGKCVAGASTCWCDKTADCAKFEDGNLCNGTLYCDKGQLPHRCELNPATPINCAKGADTACVRNLCQAKTGTCKVQTLADGTWCQDGESCTSGDRCQAAKCKPGKSICACKSNADCVAEEDGNPCNGTLFCDKSAGGPAVCKVNPATVVDCPDKGAGTCIKNVCQPKTGGCALTTLGDGAPCDDGVACPPNDVCKGGKCNGGVTPCDDGNACTTDTCQAKTGTCSHVAKVCSDADECTTDVCDWTSGLCVHVPLPDSCGDGNSCTTDYCDAKSGLCKHDAVADGGGCDDNNK